MCAKTVPNSIAQLLPNGPLRLCLGSDALQIAQLVVVKVHSLPPASTYQGPNLYKPSPVADFVASLLDQRSLAGAGGAKNDAVVAVVGVQELLDEHGSHCRSVDVAGALLQGRAKPCRDLLREKQWARVHVQVWVCTLSYTIRA